MNGRLCGSVHPCINLLGCVPRLHHRHHGAGLGLTAFVSVAVTFWTFTYMYRVASKDMTYTKQLKDYEVSKVS